MGNPRVGEDTGIPKQIMYVLRVVDYRVPNRGELYVDQSGKVQRLKEDRRYSRRAQPRAILIQEDEDQPTKERTE